MKNTKMGSPISFRKESHITAMPFLLKMYQMSASFTERKLRNSRNIRRGRG
jgi:hypothetical protein